MVPTQPVVLTLSLALLLLFFPSALSTIPVIANTETQQIKYWSRAVFLYKAKHVTKLSLSLLSVSWSPPNPRNEG